MRLCPFATNRIKTLVETMAAIVLAVTTVFSPACSTASLALTGEELLNANRAMPVDTNQIKDWPMGPVVGAESAILIEANTGTILYSKNIHTRQYPASTTKILTTLIATERCDLNEVVTFSHSAVFDTPRDSNNVAIDEGEKLTVDECIQAILIRSANECAFAVAEHMSGTTWQDFGEIMNQRAAELGCVDSHFVNPNGLPDSDHYTSAYDLAMIGRAFFANEYLCNTSISPRLHILPSANQPDEILENNAMKLVAGREYAYEYLVGCKTGYTDTARSCLVSCAEKDGMKLICVVMHDEAPYQYEDTLALFNYGFSNFSTMNVAENETKYSIGTTGTSYSKRDIFGSSAPILALNKDDYIILPKGVNFSNVSSAISYDGLEEGQAAKITYTYERIDLGQASVDFAVLGTDSYDFDSEVTEAGGRGDGTGKPGSGDSENSTIFINVAKIALIIVGSVAALFFAFVVLRALIFYRKHHRRSARGRWRRDRRRGTGPRHYSASSRRREALAAQRRRNREGYHGGPRLK